MAVLRIDNVCSGNARGWIEFPVFPPRCPINNHNVDRLSLRTHPDLAGMKFGGRAFEKAARIAAMLQGREPL
jgi:hypothetical protein